MPLLPKKNTLDYAPDSIISASKRLSTVQSSQMRDANEVNATIRPIKRDNDVKTTMNRFTDKIGEVADLFNHIRSIAGTTATRDLANYTERIVAREMGAGRRHLQRLYGGADPSEEGLSAMASLFNEPEPTEEDLEEIVPAPRRRRGRPPKAKSTERDIRSFFERIASGEDEGARHPAPEDFADRAEARGAIRSSARTEDLEDVINDADGIGEEEDSYYTGDPSEAPLDDEMTDPTADETISAFSEDTDRTGFEEPETAKAITVRQPTSQMIVQDLLKITKLLRQANTDIEHLRDFKQYLSEANIEELKMAYNVLVKKYAFFIAPVEGFDFISYLSSEIEFGENIIKSMNDERQKLMMDILTLVNSYNANEAVRPNFDPDVLIQPVKGVLDTYGTENVLARSVGAGRNFYGSYINDARDIPSIYGARRSCPTKYLL